MFIQCVAIRWCLVYVEHWAGGPDWNGRVVRDVPGLDDDARHGLQRPGVRQAGV